MKMKKIYHFGLCGLIFVLFIKCPNAVAKGPVILGDQDGIGDGGGADRIKNSEYGLKLQSAIEDVASTGTDLSMSEKDGYVWNLMKMEYNSVGRIFTISICDDNKKSVVCKKNMADAFPSRRQIGEKNQHQKIEEYNHTFSWETTFLEDMADALMKKKKVGVSEIVFYGKINVGIKSIKMFQKVYVNVDIPASSGGSLQRITPQMESDIKDMIKLRGMDRDSLLNFMIDPKASYCTRLAAYKAVSDARGMVGDALKAESEIERSEIDLIRKIVKSDVFNKSSTQELSGYFRSIIEEFFMPSIVVRRGGAGGRDRQRLDRIARFFDSFIGDEIEKNHKISKCVYAYSAAMLWGIEKQGRFSSADRSLHPHVSEFCRQRLIYVISQISKIPSSELSAEYGQVLLGIPKNAPCWKKNYDQEEINADIDKQLEAADRKLEEEERIRLPLYHAEQKRLQEIEKQEAILRQNPNELHESDLP